MLNRSAARLFTGLTVVLAAAGFVLAARQLVSGPPQLDFDAYYSAARAANAGFSLYSPAPDSIFGPGSPPAPHREYVYPPLLAGVLRPLAALPYRVAAFAWMAMNAAVIGILLVLVGQLSNTVNRHRRVTLAVLLAMPATYITLIEGQVSLMIGALILYAVVKATTSGPDERWSDVKAGVALGLAGAVKVYPVVLIPIFALHRRWRVVFAAIGSGIALTAIGGWIAGGGQELLYWFTHVLRAVAQRPWPANQSLEAVIERLGPTDPIAVWTGHAYAELSLRVVVESPALSALFVRGGQLLLVLVPAWAIWRRGLFGTALALRHDLAQGIVLMSIVVPVVWDHYYIQLLVPAAVLLDHARRNPAFRALLLGSAFCLLLQRFWRQLLLHVDASGLMLMFGLVGVLLLWLALVRLDRLPAHHGEASSGLG